jgi:dTDP-4-dehydrorhamnose reductase
MMRVLITGATGLLGGGLIQVFSGRHTMFPFTRVDADIADAGGVRAAFKRVQPEAVIHTAAIPDPDVCELDPAKAQLVNVEGTRNVAEAAREVGAVVAFISSDSIFDGLKKTPYVETDPPNPVSAYGHTKVAGEKIVRGAPEHWIFRIPILFGPGKINFIEKGLQASTRGGEYVVASDQVGCAAYTLDIGRKMMEVMEAKRYGTFHLSNTGQCNRLELAQRAAVLAGLDPTRIIGKSLDEMKRPAKRLKYQVMEMEALKRDGFASPRPWEEALTDYLRNRDSSAQT